MTEPTTEAPHTPTPEKPTLFQKLSTGFKEHNDRILHEAVVRNPYLEKQVEQTRRILTNLDTQPNVQKVTNTTAEILLSTQAHVDVAMTKIGAAYTKIGKFMPFPLRIAQFAIDKGFSLSKNVAASLVKPTTDLLETAMKSDPGKFTLNTAESALGLMAKGIDTLGPRVEHVWKAMFEPLPPRPVAPAAPAAV